MSSPRYCEQCGVPTRPQQKFCENCGAAIVTANSAPSPAPPPVSHGSPKPASHSEISWVDRSSILGANIATKQLALVIVLSLGIMQLLVGTMGWFTEGEFIVLPWIFFAVGGGVFVVLMLIAILILGNSMNMEVTLTEEGLGYRMGARSRRLSRAAILAGALAGSPRTAGAGLLATARESGFFRWRDVPRVLIRQRRRSLALYGPLLPLIEVVCTPEVYEDAVALIERHVPNIEMRP